MSAAPLHRAVAQTYTPPVLNPGNPPVLTPETARAWVHPSDGVDPVGPDAGLAYINEPSLKFQTLNSAIQAVHAYLVLHYDAAENPDQQGVVYALPGVYSATTNGEVLPVGMRDRVHVQGVGARRCILRGSSTTQLGAPNTTVVWPTSPVSSATASREILLNYADATPEFQLGPNEAAPWYSDSGPFQYNDTPEVFDGFTFQGGDVQVFLRNAALSADYFPAARISNCVFDMRHAILPHGAATPLAGPFFGIMMMRVPTYDSGLIPELVGYLDSRLLIAHNTFVFARWNAATGNGGWESESRPESVGIIDVTHCVSNVSIRDGDARHRGVGNPCITGNVFRTRPFSGSATDARPFAMLGIGREDTQVLDNTVPGGGQYLDTNAFDPARVGETNQHFFSRPVVSYQLHPPGTSLWPHWNCQNSSPNQGCGVIANGCAANPLLPTPAVSIWNGVTGVDPGFVGEYVATQIAGLGAYIDWRILPTSPLENRVFLPSAQGPRGYITQPHASDPQWIYAFNVPEELYLFAWDGEHWGNARVMDGAPDIGFDERGLLIQAGNWANDSNSHNEPGFMHPTGVGASQRWFLLPRIAAGVDLYATGRFLRLHEAEVLPPAPSAGDGWVQPPGSQSPPTNLATLPAGYRTKYITYASNPWVAIDLRNLATPWSWEPLGGQISNPSQLLDFLLCGKDDLECGGPSCVHSYFNLQGLIVEGATSTQALLRSNMIGEYR